MAEPDDAGLRVLIERNCAAFENADMTALIALLQADIRLEMPHLPIRFNVHDTVMRFLATRGFAKPAMWS